MDLQEIETRVKNLELQVRELRDIRDIEKLQRAYGYYLERWMANDIIGLFSESPRVSISVTTGEFKGIERIRQYFEYMLPKITTGFCHQVMQLSGIVDIDSNGKTAQGRWWGFGMPAVPLKKETPTHGLLTGVYEIEYVKENNIWKIMTLHWRIIAHLSPKDGWVPTEIPLGHLEADVPPISYPDGYSLPFHFKNPVTGKKRR